MLKKVTVAIALTGLMAGAAYAGINAQEGIVGSLHDMNASTNVNVADDTYKRACVFCHTPHNAIQDAYTLNAPLWNRVDTALVSPAPYSWVAPANAALNLDGSGKIAINDPLAGPTRLCMSCHDGSVAVDAHGAGNTGTAAAKLTSTNHAYVQDLTITHPIGFAYDDAFNTRGAAELVPSSGAFITGAVTTTFNTNNRPASLTTGGKVISDTLYGGIMTCATCHEVHNTANAKPAVGTTSYNYFLRAQEEGSAICLSCHVK